MWAVLLGAGVITIGFSFLFGTRHAAAQVLMTSGLAMMIGLVLFFILALDSSPGACPYVIFTEEWVAWLHCHTVDFWHC
jgi:hypothetical protein